MVTKTEIESDDVLDLLEDLHGEDLVYALDQWKDGQDNWSSGFESDYDHTLVLVGFSSLPQLRNGISYELFSSTHSANFQSMPPSTVLESRRLQGSSCNVTLGYPSGMNDGLGNERSVSPAPCFAHVPPTQRLTRNDEFASKEQSGSSSEESDSEDDLFK